MAVVDIVSSVLSGGVTGILGAAITRIADYKNKKLDLEANRDRFAHELKMREADAAIMAQEFAARTKVAEIEATAKMETADAAAFAESFKMEPERYYTGKDFTPGQSWAMIILDVLRGIVRPALTIYLCAIMTIVYMEARALMGDGSTIAITETVRLVETIINTVLYLTVTAICWWFGTRAQSRQKWGK